MGQKEKQMIGETPAKQAAVAVGGDGRRRGRGGRLRESEACRLFLEVTKADRG